MSDVATELQLIVRARRVGRRARGAIRRIVADERGAGVVTSIVVMFAVCMPAFLWLARDVDQGIHARSTATSIAFQAARSASHAVDEAALRDTGTVTLLPTLAGERAAATVQTLASSLGVTATLGTVNVDGDSVSVTVTVTQAGRTASGAATARARIGIDSPDP